jgi:hypothetical protein
MLLRDMKRLRIWTLALVASQGLSKRKQGQ